LKIGIYARVSTTDQNCDLQLTELRQFASAKGWNVIGEFVDTGVSGKRNSRPALDELMKLVRTRKVDTVICTKIDRFGRSVLNLKVSLDELNRMGVRFIAIDQGIDTEANNPLGKFMINILASMAEFELELITERRNEGIKRALENGVHFGRPKAIFRRDLAVEMRMEGKSIRAIAKALGTNLAAVQRELDAKGVSKPLIVPTPLSVALQAA
jgi:DNA invertase Pin-like site-specific DNA recombinase